MRGIRGAICVSANTRRAIEAATRRLLEEICARNALSAEEIVAAFFTMTPDLNAEFPAYVARDMGWTDVAMLGAQESMVPGAAERAIRALVLARGDGSARHVYLGRAAAMRPDLTEPGDAMEWDGAANSESATKTALSHGRLLIVGLGLIGCSVGAAARSCRRFAGVSGYDVDPGRAREAERRGYVDRLVTEFAAEVAEADIVVLAAPVDEIVLLIAKVGPLLTRGALLTDVGSVKRPVTAAMNGLPGHVRAVAGHPMAGKTESGPASADPSLFRGAEWALVATRRTDREARERAGSFVRALGALPRWMEAEAHDRAVARSSHLPVLAAIALVQTLSAARAARSADPPLLGPGFRKASRVAAGDAVMTTQMLARNADEIEPALDDYIERLTRLRGRLSERRELEALLRRAQADRSALLEEADKMGER
jgi:monofunctional chorismate mutase